MILHIITKHDIANVLNLYIVIIDTHVSESMNAGPYDHYQYLNGNYDHYQYLNGNYADSLFFAPVSSADVNYVRKLFSLLEIN